VDTNQLVGFLDVEETNMLASLQEDLVPNKIRYTQTMPASETGLFLLQPNILVPDLLSKKNFEVRGYVEIFISSLSTGHNSAKLLLTPEQRATFYKNLDLKRDEVQLDQIACSLPTSHGGSLFELSFS